MYKVPEISICMPVYNTKKYLNDRIKSIEEQTFQNYEVIIIDGFSTDGSWETICDYAKRDSRVKATQEPPKGIYDAFNKMVKKASGKYIYFATSDDTAKPGLLEELYTILDENTDCGIAQCALQIIGPNNELHPNGDSWEIRAGMKFLNEWLDKYHKRIAPYDCFIGLQFNTIYTSMTQILIRREIFDKCGYFSENYESFGDHHWHLKASLFYSCVYSPKRLATWRKHPEQASNPARKYEFRKNGERYKMAMNAIKSVKHLHLENFYKITKSILHKYYLVDALMLNTRGKRKREAYLQFAKHAFTDLDAIRFLWKNQESCSPLSISFQNIVKNELKNLDIDSPIEI